MGPGLRRDDIVEVGATTASTASLRAHSSNPESSPRGLDCLAAFAMTSEVCEGRLATCIQILWRHLAAYLRRSVPTAHRLPCILQVTPLPSPHAAQIPFPPGMSGRPRR